MMTSSINFDILIDEDNLKQNIVKMSRAIKPQWEKEIENIKIVNLNGGITNKLVACFLNQNGLDTSDTLLFRMYGKNTEKFISRENEISTMQLMKKHDIGPEFYCKFLNGICYEYLPGKIIDQKMIFDQEVSRKIAEAVASLHLVNFEAAQAFKKSEQSPFIFPKIYELLKLLNEDYKTYMPHMTDEFLKTIPSVKTLFEEIKFLENHLVNYTKQNDSLILFSHNDLLLGNIVYNDSKRSIKFIDYEYGDFNYQAYDIANHFNEFAGVEEPDYSYFPDKQYQMRWYIFYFYFIDSIFSYVFIIILNERLKIYLESFYAKVNDYYNEKKLVLDETKLNQFYIEVNKFTLASHLMWAIWSLVQAQSSQLEFNFVNYAQIRFDRYFKTKDNLINIA